MNKIFVLFASAALLLLAGCQKSENISQSQVNGDEGDFTFSVSVLDVSTKAVADNDGEASNVNHWVMEVLDADGERYNYQEKNSPEGTLTNSFTVRLVKGQKYTVLFWADTKGAYNVDSLEVVKLVNQTTYSANLDSRDAFSAVVYDFQTTQATAETVTLKRAVSQMNIIFTDLKNLYETMGSATEYGKFKPVNFKAEAKIPTTFNVKTQKAGAPATTALTITAAGDYLNNYSTHREKETLFMDYFFSSASEKDLVDIDFSFTSKGVDIKHSFTSIPFQRNYRTNIIGEFMSSNATWNVTVDPDWSSGAQGEDDIVYEVVNNIANANEVIAKEITAGKKEINVKFNSEPDDAGTPGTEGAKAIVTTKLPEDGVLNVLVETDTKSLYIGDYTNETSGEVATSGLNDAVVNVNVPEGKTIKKLVVNAPSKTVYINGAQVASAGTIEEIDAITSDNTLVIEAGQTINKLIFRQGALKIYGTVVAVEIPDVHGAIYVRDCEGLSQGVYDVLKNYIDAPKYEGVKVGEKWNIVEQQPTSFVTMGSKGYFKIEDAFKDVNSQEEDNVVITVHRDLDENMAADYTFTKNVFITTDNANGVIIDLNCVSTEHTLISNAGKTLTVDTKVTISNLMQMFAGYGDADSKAVVKGQLNSMQIWAYKGGMFYIVPGAKVVCAYGDGMVKFRYDSEINVEDNVESAASIDVTKDTPIFKSGYLSGDKDGAKVLNLKNSFTQTQWLSNSGNGSFTVNMDNAVLYAVDDLHGGLNFGTTAAGNISMKNGSRIITDGPVAIKDGTVSIEAGSTITAKSFTSAGAININASNYTGGKLLVISATSASTYTNVTVTGNYEPVVENNCLYIQVPEPATEVKDEGELRTAISNASAGDNIKLTGSITISNPLTIDKAVTINLGGNTITTGSSLNATDASKRPINIKADGVVLKNGTIYGSSVTAGYALINVHNSCTLENIVATTPGVPINVREACTLEIKGENGAYESSGTYSNKCYEAGIFVSSLATVNIYGGIFTGKSYAACIASSGGTINISGGIFNEGSNGYSLLNDGYVSSTPGSNGHINISGSPVIHGDLRGRSNDCKDQLCYINISGGTYDSDCRLYNYDENKITLSNGYTKTFVSKISSSNNSGSIWTLTKNN